MKVKVTKQQEEDIKSMFALTNILESLLRKNEHVLSLDYKSKVKTALLHLKWLNKDLERHSPDNEAIDAIDSEGANIYEIIRVLRHAKRENKTNEFIKHVDEFFKLQEL